MKKILLVFLLWIGSLNIYPQYNVDQPMSLIEVNGVSIAYTTTGEQENTQKSSKVIQKIQKP